MNRILILLLALGLLAGCSTLQTQVDSSQLASLLAAQPEEVQARYQYRHPQETLAFFGIAPGMTVVEGLPGGGWYTKILLPYLGQEGHLIGADYAREMWPLFEFFDGEIKKAEFLKAKETWVVDWVAEAKEWAGENGAPVSAFVFGSMPEEVRGKADAVLLIRALHNLALFEDEGGFLTVALQNAYDALKSGGIVAVVQHSARDNMSDDWASGENGYLKRDFVIKQMEEAGFEFEASTEINANEKDQPTEEDDVWRLPPALDISEEDPELQAKMEAIGESNRMTLRFRKP